jgi:hypothetical protein
MVEEDLSDGKASITASVTFFDCKSSEDTHIPFVCEHAVVLLQRKQNSAASSQDSLWGCACVPFSCRA